MNEASDRPKYKRLTSSLKAFGATVGVVAALWGIIASIDNSREYDRDQLRKVLGGCNQLIAEVTMQTFQRELDNMDSPNPSSEDQIQPQLSTEEENAARKRAEDRLPWIGEIAGQGGHERNEALAKLIQEEEKQALREKEKALQEKSEQAKKKRMFESLATYQKLLSPVLSAVGSLPERLQGPFADSLKNIGTESIDAGFDDVPKAIDRTCSEFERIAQNQIRRTYVIPFSH